MLNLLKKAVGLALLAATVRYGVLVMAYSALAGNFISQLINSWPNRKLLDYGYLEQMKDIFPNVALAAMMGALVWPVQLFGWGSAPTLCVQVLLGAAIYAAGSVVTNNESFRYLWGIIRPALRRGLFHP